MGQIARASISFAATIALLTIAPAIAQAAPRTWVASNGSDAFATICSRTAPCASFQVAHNATDPGGEINCIDAGEYHGLLITKSITIDCSGLAAGVQTGGINGIVINAPGAIVTLRGLMIDATEAATVGVLFHNGRALHIDKCWISGFRTFDATGIQFLPPAGVTAKLEISDSVISDNGVVPSGGGGIVIQPTGSGSARVSLTRVQVENNSLGIFANGARSTGLIVLQVRDSVIAGSTDYGIYATTLPGASTVSVTVDHTAVILNKTGIAAQNAGAFVILGSSTVALNIDSLSMFDGGQIISYQNNQLESGVPRAVVVER
jgi:hypothetical protein